MLPHTPFVEIYKRLLAYQHGSWISILFYEHVLSVPPSYLLVLHFCDLLRSAGEG
jgi:hypothetical protein